MFDQSVKEWSRIRLLFIGQEPARCCKSNNQHANEATVKQRSCGIILMTICKNRRNLMEESARLSRGTIKNIKELNSESYDALVIPGGSGVAKNLCNFLLKGANFTIEPAVEATVKSFAAQKKSLAFCCIAPVIAAKLFGKKFGGPGAEMTMGKVVGASWPYKGTVGNILTQTMQVLLTYHNRGLQTYGKFNGSGRGYRVLRRQREEAIHNSMVFLSLIAIIFFNSYLKGDAKPHEVLEGIDKMITQMVKDIKGAAI